MWVELSAFGVALVSALVPFVNIELYLAALAPNIGSGLGAFTVAVVAGFGQALGKLVWYYGGAVAFESPWVQKKLGKPSVRESVEKWRDRLHDRAWFTTGIMLLSASVGLPPMLAMAFVAGVIKMPWWAFFLACFVGRTIRFWAVVAGVDVVSNLL